MIQWWRVLSLLKIKSLYLRFLINFQLAGFLLDDSWVKVDFIPGPGSHGVPSPGLHITVLCIRGAMIPVHHWHDDEWALPRRHPATAQVTSNVKGGENIKIFCQISLKTKSPAPHSHTSTSSWLSSLASHHSPHPGVDIISKFCPNIQIEKFTFLEDTDHTTTG